VLRDAHEVGGWVVTITNLAVAVWALAATKVASLRGRRLWFCTAAAQGLVFVQVALGVWMLNHDSRPVPELHTLYGFLCLATIAILYAYKDQLRHRLYLLYGLGGLFLVGLGLRALFIGPGS
jgi:MFS family permease